MKEWISDRIDAVTGAKLSRDIQALREEVEDPLCALALRLTQLQDAAAESAEREVRLRDQVRSLEERLARVERPEKESPQVPPPWIWLAVAASIVALLLSLVALLR
jgi:hypothetical protein